MCSLPNRIDEDGVAGHLDAAHERGRQWERGVLNGDWDEAALIERITETAETGAWTDE